MTRRRNSRGISLNRADFRSEKSVHRVRNQQLEDAKELMTKLHDISMAGGSDASTATELRDSLSEAAEEAGRHRMSVAIKAAREFIESRSPGEG